MGTVYAVHLYLVRHGVTEWNRQGRYYGQTDLPCLPHMWHLFDGLKSRLAGLVFDQVYSSDLTRCRQTLDYLAPSVAKSACYDHRLREYHFGAWEGRTHTDLEQDHLYQAWLNDMESVAPSGGEEWAQFKGRIDQWLSEVLTTHHRPVRILTVTHGGVIRYLLSQWGVTSSMWEAPIHTGQAYVLELSREKGGMEMYCIVGGAFSGKRAFVRSCTQGQKLSWVSAYQGHDWRDWPDRWSEKTVLVMEGFEVWIKQALDQQQNPQYILDSFHALFSQLQEEEAKRRLDDNQSAVYLIMLEMGRGIVPLSPEERSWRDLSGWVAQSGSVASEHVYILWHGLAQQLK